MSHEVETMAYANEVPWHGLGNPVDPTVSIEEMLVAAGLDWKVQMHPTFARVGDEYVRVPNKSALLRETDRKVLTVASDNWKPLQNLEVLEFFREYAKAGGAKLETAGSLRGGKLVWGLANLGHGFRTNGGRDAVRGHLLFASPHEMGKASSVRVTATRVVCANTMAIAMGDNAMVYTQNHLRNFNFDAARETMDLAHEGMVQLELNVQALEQLQLSEYDTVRFLSTFFQPVDDEADIKTLIEDPTFRNQQMNQVMLCLEQAPGATPGNGWGVMNAVTYWTDHVAGRDRDARLTKSWFGENSLLKQNVERELLKLTA